MAAMAYRRRRRHLALWGTFALSLCGATASVGGDGREGQGWSASHPA